MVGFEGYVTCYVFLRRQYTVVGTEFKQFHTDYVSFA